MTPVCWNLLLKGHGAAQKVVRMSTRAHLRGRTFYLLAVPSKSAQLGCPCKSSVPLDFVGMRFKTLYFECNLR